VFSRRERLSKEDFPAALSGGRRLSSTNLSILIPNGVKGYAVVVSKKIARLSVDRHRIKRRVLAALRTTNLPPALIVFPKSSACSVSYKDIQTELATLLSK